MGMREPSPQEQAARQSDMIKAFFAEKVEAEVPQDLAAKLGNHRNQSLINLI